MRFTYRNLKGEQGERTAEPGLFKRRRFPAGRRIKVEEFFSPAQITEEKGFLYTRSRLREDEWVYGMILSYGDACEVVSPPSVREKIKSIVGNLHKRYRA